MPDRIETSFASDTDAELLAYVAMAAEDREGALAAFDVFYRRHARWLYRTIQLNSPLARLLGGQEGIQDVVQETFRLAYERAATFTDGGITDPDRLLRRARAWLGRIATNLIADGRRRRTSISAEDCDPWEDHEEALLREIPRPDDESDKATRLRELVEKLPEREKEIIYAAAQHYRPGDKFQRLPNGLCKELADRWKTTPENIRQIRHRLYKMLRDALEHPDMAKETDHEKD